MGSAVADGGSLDCEEEAPALRVYLQAKCLHFRPVTGGTKQLLVKVCYWPTTGAAVITTAGTLPARHVIHAVGPIWGGGQRGQEQQLAHAYQRSLEVALENGCQSVAFPSLSTGAYSYPVELAARTALRTVMAFLHHQQQPALVRFVLFDTATHEVFAAALAEVQAE